MRIRKPPRNASSSVRVAVPEPDVVMPIAAAAGPLLQECDSFGDGRPKSASTSSTTSEVGKRGVKATTPVDPASGLESMSTLSRQSPSPGVSMLLQQDQPPPPPPGGLEDHAELGVEEDSIVSVDQVWQVQYGDYMTRHYVRRTHGARKEGVAAPALLAQSEPNSTITTRTNTLEIGEDEGMKSKTAMPPPASGADNRQHNPRQPEAGELDSEHYPEDAHPSTAPEGSLLHTLYLQLLAAGSEGITLRELFASFKKQTALPSVGSDWKEQVRAHLKNNSHIDEIKGHFVLCDQLVNRPKRSPTASTATTLRRPHMGTSPRTTNTSGRHAPSRRIVQSAASAVAAVAVLPLFVEKQSEGVRTRRRAYELTIEAVLNESAMEFEKMQQQNMGESSVAHTPTRKRKSSSSENEDGDGNKTIRGSLQALQAKIVAETGAQPGVPCARKDDARRWRCPMMAMEGHSLCMHHKALQLRKRVRKQEQTRSRRSARERTKLETTGRLSNRRLKADLVQDSDTEISSPEKEDVAPEKEDVADALGGGHVVEVLMDLQGQQTGVPLNTFGPQEAATEAKEDHPPATNQGVSEEAECESKAIDTDESPASSDGEPGAILGDSSFEKATPGSLKALQAKIVAENGGVNDGVRCARKDGSNDSARKWQCPLNAMEGHTLCEHHNYLKERKRVRYADAKRVKAGGRRRGKAPSSSIRRLPVSNSPPEEVQAAEEGSEDEKSDHESSELPMDLPDGQTPHKPAKGTNSKGKEEEEEEAGTDSKGKEDEEVEAGTDSKGKEEEEVEAEAEVVPQTLKEPKRWYVAAKKTAANVEGVKEKSQERETSSLIRAPTVPPLQAYGVRRKAVKNRSLHTL